MALSVVGGKLSTAGLKANFMERYGATAVLWKMLASEFKSTTGKETYAWLGSVPPMREWGQGRLARSLFPQEYSIENQLWENTIEVARTEVDDDQIGGISMRVSELAEKAAMLQDQLLASLLINGGTAGFNAYDGKTFFATDHESGKSGAQSNDVTFNCTDHTAPTIAELRAAVAKMITQLLKLKDDQAEPMNASPTGLVLVVPPDLYIPALEAINATIVSNTSTTNPLTSACKVESLARLTDAAVMYLFKTDVAVRAFAWQDRDKVEFTWLESESETAFLREKYLYGARVRGAMSYAYWQRCVRCTLN